MIGVEVKSRKQLNSWSCGPASLRTIFHFYGVNVSEQELIDDGDIGEEGTGFQTMRMLARKHNFSFYSAHKGTLNDIKKWLSLNTPILICYQHHELTPNGNNGHYSVVYGIDNYFVHIADPSNYFEGDLKKFTGPKKITIEKFLNHWWELDHGTKVKRWYAIIKPSKKKNEN
jgi:predicted double-glycine peptidase